MSKQRNKTTNPTKNHGFTLIEMLVVVSILATLMAIIAPNLINRAEQAKVTKARADIQVIESAMDMYKLDNSVYPSADQGINALVTKPGGSPEARNWQQYLKQEKKDPWGNEYYYAYPGENGAFDIYSLGADGQPGGEGTDADIGNWNAD